MLTPFSKLSDDATIWIYQADRPLTAKECEWILQQASLFADHWHAHGHPLQCGVDLRYRHFLVLGVDEHFQRVTDCAVDRATKFMQGLAQQLSINWFNRTQIAFLKDGKAFLVPLGQIQQYLDSGQVTPDTLVFDHTISKKKALDTGWQIPAQNSWIRQCFQ